MMPMLPIRRFLISFLFAAMMIADITLCH